jgi:hypothetical protein
MLNLRSRLTYANVVATLALFLALGGAAYAVSKLPRNSVGAKQIKKSAVTGIKVRNGSLTGADVKAASLTGAAVKPASLTGANVADGSLTGAKVADASLSGADLQDASVPASKITGLSQPGGTLGSGTTLRGVFSPRVDANNSTSVTAGEGVSFGGYRLQARPLVNIIPPAGSSTTACPGSTASPEAASGNLCVYINSANPSTGQMFVMDPASSGNGLTFFLPSNGSAPIGDGKASLFGFNAIYIGTGTGPVTGMTGTWAVTG